MRITEWHKLSAAEQRALLARPAQLNAAAVAQAAHAIVEQVRREGDTALQELTRRFDGEAPGSLAVSESEAAAAEATLTAEQHAAIDQAIQTVHHFHAAQMPVPIRIETAPGVTCERIQVPIGAVGLYVPAGAAPLPSTAIMLGVPAAIAGCPVRILCTAPMRDGHAHPSVIVAARRAGIRQIFKVGGAQAIAAMAYGTQSVPKCDKLFGPGNAYVTAAKMLVSRDPEGAAADLPAGPSEVMVIADQSASFRFVAADLLAQAEHSPDAQALLVSTCRELAVAVAAEVERQAQRLTRRSILAESLQSLRLIVVADTAQAFEIANRYAPEHLLLEIRDARSWLPSVACAGAVFLGHWSPESLGDYCSGPNHTLPTYGYARAYSGLSLEDFQKRITVQEASQQGLRGLGPTARVLAELEGLDAHAAAVNLRLEALV